MIKAVIFDLDGTLLNRDASVISFVSNQYDRYRDVFGHIPKQQYMSKFIEYDCRGYVWKDKVYQQLVKEYQIQLPWETLLQDYMENFKRHCVPFPHLESMLDTLKNRSLKLGIISNGREPFQSKNISALGIGHFFDAILISESEGIRKPDPLIFQRALERLNVQAFESMYVGDHPMNDVKAARSVGMLSVWKKDNQWEDVNADYCIDELSELPGIVEELTFGKTNNY
ncbi:HAD family hydrolase [Sporosarcina sp. OR05]|uniref:HAD family hydrolase n=1 Tax=Sporosarcina sp. OR05 TaxID=2969819 RepID=UPI003529EC75